MTRRPSGFGGFINARPSSAPLPLPEPPEPPRRAPKRLASVLVMPAKPSAPREDAASRPNDAPGGTDAPSAAPAAQRGAQRRATVSRNLVTDPEAARRLFRF